MKKIFLSAPTWGDFRNTKCIDFAHTIHKLTFGLILINHIEPDGRTAEEHHKKAIIFRLL